MKHKLLNITLLIASLIGYLEWGGGNKQFLFQSEYEVLSKILSNPTSIMHPFVVLPLVGQILLLITLFQSKPTKAITYIAIGCIGILLLFMFIVGAISLNAKIVFSTLPFLLIAFFTIKENKQHKK